MIGRHALFLLAVISLSAAAQSQPPTPGPAKASKPPKAQADGGKQDAKHDQRGTKEIPFFVEGQVTTVRSKTDADRDAYSGEEQATVSRWTMILAGFTALFTLAIATIAGFQLRMFRNQLRLMRTTAEDSKALAEAARLQSRALVASQIPVVAWNSLKLVAYDELDKPTDDPYPSGPVPVICRPVFVFQNTGPTKILTLYYAMKWEVAPNVEGQPHFGGMTYDGVLLRADQSRAFTIGAPIKLSEEQRRLIESNKASLWAYGFVYYNDFLDEGHQMGTIAKWDMARGFVQVVREHYSYHRHQKVYTHEHPEARQGEMPVRA